MMKLRCLLCGILILFSSQLFAKKTTMEKGIKLFENHQYDLAILSFQEEIKKNKSNVSAYFNLGLAYNASKEYGNAVWAFEKALKLKPNDTEVKESILLTYDQLGSDSTWIPTLSHFEESVYSLSSNLWAILTIIFSVICAIFLVLYRKSKQLSKKRMFLLFCFLGTAFMLFSLIIASKAYSFEHSTYAIVTDQKIETFKNDNVKSNSTTGLTLKEGTKLKVIKSTSGKDGKVNVETMNGKSHIVFKKDIKNI